MPTLLTLWASQSLFRGPDRSLDTDPCGVYGLVLPKSHHSPSGLYQPGRYAAISLAVPFELGYPVVRVGFWCCAMLRTSMPKAPVDKNCNSSTGEDDVHFAASTIRHSQQEILPETTPMRM
jgi:hypothetical protein